MQNFASNYAMGRRMLALVVVCLIGCCEPRSPSHPEILREAFGDFDEGDTVKDVTFLRGASGGLEADKPFGKLLLTTEEGALVRSTNEGSLWTRQWMKKEHNSNPDSLEDGLRQEMSETEDEWWKVVQVDEHPKHGNLLFLTGQGKINWLSEDGGETYSPVVTAFALRGFKWHPFEKWALAYKTNIQCMEMGVYRCYGRLMLSTDGGYTWGAILTNVKYPNYDWKPGHGEGEEASRDVLAVQHSASDHGPDQQWDTDLNFVAVTDVMYEGGQRKTLLPRSLLLSLPHTDSPVAGATTLQL